MQPSLYEFENVGKLILSHNVKLQKLVLMRLAFKELEQRWVFRPELPNQGGNETLDHGRTLGINGAIENVRRDLHKEKSSNIRKR